MLHVSWPDQPADDPKTRTAVLYRGRHMEAWGWTAWRRWSSMSRDERATGGYTFLTGFKLLLEDGGGGGGGGHGHGGDGDFEDAARGTEELGHSPERVRAQLRASLPPGLTAVHVVTDFLGAVRRYIVDHLASCQRLGHHGAGFHFHPDRVVWCLTLPAMWSDGAKDKMRQAAMRAGYIRTVDSKSLLLTLEPEAAALSAAKTVAPPPSPMPLAAPPAAATKPSSSLASVVPGDVLLVLDCGGGTADVTMHRVVAAGPARPPAQPPPAAAAASAAGPEAASAAEAAGGRVKLREAAVGDGTLAGGCFVDEALWALLRQTFGTDPWDTWVAEHPADWTHLRDTWEEAKRSFVGIPPLPNLLRPAATSAAAAAAAASRRAPPPTGAAAEALAEQLYDWGLVEAAAYHPAGPLGHEGDGVDGDGGGDDGDTDGFVGDACYVRLEGKYDISLRLPQSLMESLPLETRQALERGAHGNAASAAAATASPGLRPWLLASDLLPALVLPGEVLERRVFGPVVDAILALARRVAEEGRGNGLPATKVLLAGGFACSPYLQRRVRDEVAGMLGPGPGQPLPLLLPKYPAAAVLTGAVLYGRDPLSVSARAVRLSYGIAATAPWSAEHEASLAAKGYPEKSHNDEDGSDFADEVFAPFVVRGQLVEADEVVERFFAPLHKSQDSIFFDLYGTHARDASYLREPGMRRLASAVLRLPSGWEQCDEVRREGSWGYIVQADLCFGASEITLTARNPRTSETVATTIEWSSDAAPGATRRAR